MEDITHLSRNNGPPKDKFLHFHPNNQLQILSTNGYQNRNFRRSPLMAVGVQLEVSNGPARVGQLHKWVSLAQLIYNWAVGSWASARPVCQANLTRFSFIFLTLLYVFFIY